MFAPMPCAQSGSSTLLVVAQRRYYAKALRLSTFWLRAAVNVHTHTHGHAMYAKKCKINPLILVRFPGGANMRSSTRTHTRAAAYRVCATWRTASTYAHMKNA